MPEDSKVFEIIYKNEKVADKILVSKHELLGKLIYIFTTKTAKYLAAP